MLALDPLTLQQLHTNVLNPLILMPQEPQNALNIAQKLISKLELGVQRQFPQTVKKILTGVQIAYLFLLEQVEEKGDLLKDCGIGVKGYQG